MYKTKESELKYVLDYSREDYMDFFHYKLLVVHLIVVAVQRYLKCNCGLCSYYSQNHLIQNLVHSSLIFWIDENILFPFNLYNTWIIRDWFY